MRTGLAVSTVAHASLILLAMAGLSLSSPLEPTPEESISVDLVPVDDFSNVRMGALDSKIVETETPAVVNADKPAELAQPTGNTEQDQPTPEAADTPTPAPTQQTAPAPLPADPIVAPVPEPEPPPPAEAAPAPEPDPPAEPAPDPVMPAPPLATPVETPDPANTAPVPIVKTASLDDKRAAYKKQVEAQKQQQVATADDKAAKAADKILDLINSEDTRGAATGSGGEATLGKQDGRSARLTQSETAGLIAQMRTCWNLLPSEIESNLSVRLLVSLNRDGTVSGSPQIIEQDSSPMGISIARAAVLAVRKCGPYRLDVAKYDDWQQVDVTFRPSDL